MSRPHCCSSRFSMKTLHTVIVIEIFHMSDVLEYKTWILSPLAFYFVEWFYGQNYFLLLFYKTQSRQSRPVSDLSLAACHPCITHSALLLRRVLLCLRWGVQTLYYACNFPRVHATCWLFLLYVRMCVWTGFHHCTKTWLPCSRNLSLMGWRGGAVTWTECTDCVWNRSCFVRI